MQNEFANILGIDQGTGAISLFQLMDRLDAGLPLSALTALAERLAPSDAAFAFRFVPRATLARRKAGTQVSKLSSMESAKVARMARVWALAREIWDSDDAARAFLDRPHAMLEGERPLDVVLRSEFGGPLVESILGRLRYGTAA